jgi:hypothetical protein
MKWNDKYWWYIGGAAMLGIGVTALIYRKQIAKVLLTAEQELYISQLNPLVRDKFRRFIRDAEKMGYEVDPTSGYRSWAKQNQLKAAGKTPVAGGDSLHNYGMALDVNLIKGDKRWKMATPHAEWEATGIPEMAAKHGLTWGGDFSGYYDPVHFADKRYPVDYLKQLAYDQFNTQDPNKIEGNLILLA